MRIAVGVIFVIYWGFFDTYVATLPLARDVESRQEKFQRTYEEISDDTVETPSLPQPNNSKKDQTTKVKQTQEQPPAHLLIEAIRRRNKRHNTYLTLCHFKICNMGRKRPARYYHPIRRLDAVDT